MLNLILLIVSIYAGGWGATTTGKALLKVMEQALVHTEQSQ